MDDTHLSEAPLGLKRSNSTGVAKLEKGELKLKASPEVELSRPDPALDEPAQRQHDAVRAATLANPEILEKDGLPKDGASPKRPPPLGKEIDSMAKFQEDGRIDIFWNQRTKALSRMLVPALSSQLKLSQGLEAQKPLSGIKQGYLPPKLNIAIHVVGSRGDVQPFVSLGVELKEKHGHRVRLATHPCFKDLVEQSGLEFFSISGDPSELMAFMVKNPGLMPGIDSIKNGDITKRRDGMYKILKGCWRSCIEPGNGLDEDEQSAEYQSEPPKPFIAEAIIANPPSFAHAHIAEKLNIPLHIMFTMPWTPTQAFPHPLANIQSNDTDPKTMNFLSYILVEMMTWQGLGDLVNRFRTRTLRLKPLQTATAVNLLSQLKVPHTYCWSPGLIPKPLDWGNSVSLSGFFFLPLGSKYTPPDDLKAFLEAGPPPVYIGFGSIVVDDPTGLTNTIFAAVKKAGVRALVSKGWGGLGGDELDVPENVFLLGNCPHDWLFKHVSAVVHHGGAGTTAAGMAAARPTVIVPFFGDQPFWGSMVARATDGPLPIPFKQLDADKLANAIKEALVPSVAEKAKEVAAVIAAENGARDGVANFHENLPLETMVCSVLKERPAVWRHKPTGFLLSPLAATVLASSGKIKVSDLRLHRAKQHDTNFNPIDPFTGAAVTIGSTAALITLGSVSMAKDANRSIKNYKERSNSRQGSHSRQNLSRTVSRQSFVRDSASITSPSIASSEAVITEAPSETTLTHDDIGKESNEECGKGRTNSDSTISSHSSGYLQIPGSPPERKDSASSYTTSGSLDGPEVISGPETKDMRAWETAVRASKISNWTVVPGANFLYDLTHALARGFHNAPKLYHDQTVKDPPKITGFHSGLRVAGSEGMAGIVDGTFDIYRQPKLGAQQEGVKGFFKGVGKGIGGFLIKPSQTLWALAAYPIKGAAEELRKVEGHSIMNYLIEMRKAQGQSEWYVASEKEKAEILKIWEEIKTDPPKKRKKKDPKAQKAPSQPVAPTSSDKVAMPLSPVIVTTSHDKEQQVLSSDSHGPVPPNGTESDRSLSSGSRASHSPSDHSEEEVEAAIAVAVDQTSNGDSKEDELIKRALRASLERFKISGSLYTPEDIDSAIKASIAEANKAGTSDGYQFEGSELAASIRKHLEEQGHITSATVQSSA